MTAQQTIYFDRVSASAPARKRVLRALPSGTDVMVELEGSTSAVRRQASVHRAGQSELPVSASLVRPDRQRSRKGVVLAAVSDGPAPIVASRADAPAVSRGASSRRGSISTRRRETPVDAFVGVRAGVVSVLQLNAVKIFAVLLLMFAVFGLGVVLVDATVGTQIYGNVDGAGVGVLIAPHGGDIGTSGV